MYAAEDESRQKNNGGRRLRKKPKPPAEVCPPVRLRACPDHRTAPDRLGGVAHRHPLGDGRGTIARSDEFAAVAGWRASRRIPRGKTICAAALGGWPGEHTVFRFHYRRRDWPIRARVSNRQVQTSRASTATEIRACRRARNPHQRDLLCGNGFKAERIQHRGTTGFFFPRRGTGTSERAPQSSKEPALINSCPHEINT